MATIALREDREATSLWREYARTRDQSVRNILVVRNLPLVYSIANRLAANSPEPVEDLVQEGSLALIRAVEGFSPGRETRFSTYAFPVVQGAIKNYLSRKAPTRLTESHLEELTPPEELELLRGHEAPDFTVQVVDRLVTQTLLSRLPPMEREIVAHFFYEDLTQKEISNTLARSSARISRLLRRALERLKQALVEIEQEISASGGEPTQPLVDASTGLFTRIYLHRCLRHEIARSRLQPGQSWLALFRLGADDPAHDSADAAQTRLRAVADAVKDHVRVCDHVFRAGQHEIAVLFLRSAHRAQRACDRIVACALKQTGVSLSVGVSRPGKDAADPEALLTNAGSPVM